MGDRVIFHCDCNSFYASVELLGHSELAHLPVAVSGSTENRHGIILAKNEMAKNFKVQTAETVWQAKRKCPDLILLPPHRREYRKYSDIINAIYADYTDQVEPFGIDESWLDVTGSWKLFANSPKALADFLRARVRRETGLSISVGISFNKVFAKLGSDYKKPDATTVIFREDVEKILWPLPAAYLLYVGNKAAQSLAELGIHTIGDLAQADPALLTQVLGKQGRQMNAYALGLDEASVARIGEREPVKSVGNGLTFRRNLLGHRDVRTAVGALADEVAGRLRRQKLYATNLQVLIKKPDLQSISRQKTLPYATNLGKDIGGYAMKIITAHWDYAKPIRMLTLTGQKLTDLPFASQTSLFGVEPGMDPKREKLEESMDNIRQKYGSKAIVEGSLIKNDLGLAMESDFEDGDEKEG